MRAESLNGVGISTTSARGLTVTSCDFSRLAIGCDFTGADELTKLEIERCTFRDSVVWPVRLPATSGNAGAKSISFRTSKILDDVGFDSLAWTGYGYDPRTDAATVAVGSSVTIYASAVSTSDTTFKWRKNGKVIPGEKGPELRFTKVHAKDSGIYTAVATNAAGSATSNAAVLVVSSQIPSTVAPVIVTQPADTTAKALGTVTFSAAASGTPAPSYQWMKNGAEIPGATAATLTLKNVTVADVGAYTVRVSNTAGSLISRVASLLNVIEPVSHIAPSITVQPRSRTAIAYQTVTFAAVATGSPKPSYQWMKNGVPMRGQTGSTLTLRSITGNDVASYTVTVSNAAGSISSLPAKLTVTIPPSITTQPASQIVKVNADVTFAVHASGLPAPTLQWRKDGVAIPGATSATLTLRRVASKDSGSYVVVASNVSGSETSKVVTLAVQAPAPPKPPPASPPPKPSPVEPPDSGISKPLVNMVSMVLSQPVRAQFIVGGSKPRSVLIRAVGPTIGLMDFPVPLDDPMLKLFRNGMQLDWNDNWGGRSELSAAFAEAGLFPYAHGKSKDSALLVELPPGTYQAVVSSRRKSAFGLVMIQVYELP